MIDGFTYRYVVVSNDGLGEYWKTVDGVKPVFQEFGFPYPSFGEAQFVRDDLVHLGFFCYVRRIRFKEVNHVSAIG